MFDPGIQKLLSTKKIEAILKKTILKKYFLLITFESLDQTLSKSGIYLYEKIKSELTKLFVYLTLKMRCLDLHFDLT